MTGDCHVQFGERLVGKFRRPTQLDINYIGSPDKNIMLQERDEFIRQIEEVCLDKDYVSQRKPSEHAGGKWTLRYNSARYNFSFAYMPNHELKHFCKQVRY